MTHQPPAEASQLLESEIRHYAVAVGQGGDLEAAFEPLITATSRLPLCNLERYEQAFRWSFPHEVDQARGKDWRFWRRPSVFVTWLDICSPDGFVRERAVRAIQGKGPNAFFLCLLMRRLNDWVPQVRKACEESLSQVLVLSDPAAVVKAMVGTFTHWNSWGHLSDEGRAVVWHALDDERVKAAFVAYVSRATSGPAAQLLAQANGTGALDVYVRHLATDAVQPAVRATACRWLMEGQSTRMGQPSWGWTDKNRGQGRLKRNLVRRPLSQPMAPELAMRLALADRSSLVRRIVGDGLIRALDNPSEELLSLARLLAADPHPAIAERGRFAVDLCTAKLT